MEKEEGVGAPTVLKSKVRVSDFIPLAELLKLMSLRIDPRFIHEEAEAQKARDFLSVSVRRW